MEDLTNKKVLIFSDTHLTCKFDEAHFEALKEIILKADKIIINGDFWEYIACDFEPFVNSEWAEKLFPLLKEKNTIFLHGNHDPERLTTWEGIKKFADERGKDYKFKSGDKVFKVEHGDLISLEFDEYYRKVADFIHNHLPSLYLFAMDFEYKKHFLGRLWHKYMNHRRKIDMYYMKKFSYINKREKVLRIFGHIHMKKHNFKDHFMVLGEFKKNRRNYVFIKDGVVKFFSDRY